MMGLRKLIVLPSLLALQVAACASDGVIDLTSGGSPNAEGEAGVGSDAAPERDDSCTSQGQCSAPLAYCDLETESCVECLIDTHCEESVCEPASHTCVDCTRNADCEDDEICDTSRWLCVQCMNDTGCLEPGTACNLASGQCVQTCQSNEECTEESEPWCVLSTGFCAECRSTADCEPGASCNPATNRCTES